MDVSDLESGLRRPVASSPRSSLVASLFRSWGPAMWILAGSLALAAFVAIAYLVVTLLALSSSVEAPQTVAPGYSCRYLGRESYERYDSLSTRYDLAFVADHDKGSKQTDGSSWGSILKRATLQRLPDGSYSIEMGAEEKLISRLNEGGRGMELSDLVYFNGMVLAGDDRTGSVFELRSDGRVVPRWILMEGDGHTDKGMKIEWMTVKDGALVVGSSGKDWTTADGKFLSNNPKWIKTIGRDNRLEHSLDWSRMYQAVADAAGIQSPGYLWHEAVQWNARDRRWFFMPRRESQESYDEEKDEERGSNLLVSLDAHGGDPVVSRIGEKNPLRGTSAFQFVPWREDEIVVVRSEEHRGSMRAFVSVAKLDGEILLQDTLIGEAKYEGVEFI